MKFLADMGIALTVVRALREWGHDALHVRECLAATSADEEILNFAAREDRVILTMDHDFGDLLYWRGSAIPSLIFFRVTDEKPGAVLEKLRLVVDEASESLRTGAIVIVEDTRLRIRTLPIQ